MAEMEELGRRLREALHRIATSHATSAELAAENATQIASLLEENSSLAEQVEELQTQPATPSAGADPAELEALQGTVNELQSARSSLEEALEAERQERMTQAEALAEAIAERGRLLEAQDQAAIEREQLVEQAQRIAEREALKIAEARAELEDLRGRIDALEAGADKLREANRQLRSNNAALREAHMAGIADADLVNQGLQAELDALAAVRAADRAELDGVLAALRPMLEEAADA